MIIRHNFLACAADLLQQLEAQQEALKGRAVKVNAKGCEVLHAPNGEHRCAGTQAA